MKNEEPCTGDGGAAARLSFKYNPYVDENYAAPQTAPTSSRKEGGGRVAGGLGSAPLLTVAAPAGSGPGTPAPETGILAAAAEAAREAQLRPPGACWAGPAGPGSGGRVGVRREAAASP